MMNYALCVSLSDQVNVRPDGDDRIQFTIEKQANQWRPDVTLKLASPTIFNAFEKMKNGSIAMPELYSMMIASEGMNGMGKIKYYLNTLGRNAMLEYRMMLESEPFATLQPISTYFTFNENKVKKETPFFMSRFAYFRNRDGHLELSSPLGYARVILHQPNAMTAMHHLGNPCSAEELGERIDDLNVYSALMFMNLLANAGALQEHTGNGSPENDDPALGRWAFHDLLFHAGSRLGRHNEPYGGTYPFRNKFPPVPPYKQPMSGEYISLYKPDLDNLKDNDIPFTLVLESRQTIRKYGREPINVEQLGEWLYRTARIKHLHEKGAVTWRPSPNGGACHEIEIYPIVNNCRGLAFGAYHYDPKEHRLYRLTNAPAPIVSKLLAMSKITGTLDQDAQVLLVLTARFQRTQEKYESMAYALTLKNLGCLYQTMYLVATAMDLAPCGLGGGESDLFCQVAGINYYEETSIGEFLLGSTDTTQNRESYQQSSGSPDNSGDPG